MINFDNIWVDVRCPKCEYEDGIQLIDFKSEKQVFCHNCKSIITLVDNEASVHSGIQSMVNSMKELEKTFDIL
jgi:ribosomal protein S27E